MKFRDAWNKMLSGYRVKLPSWGGYWAWEDSPRGGKSIMMHMREGNVIDIRDTDDPAYTFSNVASSEWIIDERMGMINERH